MSISAPRGHRFPIVIGVFTIASLIALAGCSTSSSDPSADEIRIGLEAPLSGDQKSVGIGMLNGAKLAADELNANGGINGKQVVIVEIDDAADPETGVKAAETAIADGLDAVVGPYNSGVGVETLPLYIDAGIVPLRLTSANSTEGLGFTLQPMTSQIAPAATTAITDWAQASKVAIIFDSTEAYTLDANTAMLATLAAAGVTVTIDLAIEPSASSYDDAVAEVMSTSPDLVYVITYYPEGGLIAKAMFDTNAAAKCLADYGAYDNGFLDAAGIPAAKNCPVVGVPAPSDFPNSTEPFTAFTEAFGVADASWAPYSYDSVKVLAAAATAAGGFEVEELTAALNDLTEFSGWTGRVSFEAATGNRTPAPVVVVRATDAGHFTVDSTWVAATGFEF